ncbi:hypothetical protein [Xanthomonas translucens]|uniref:Uncharacterized protein n=3 Tax=Xanthomonas campestris pv. translucens TaxID=343 RepID=A0ABW9KT22_XANCT|nr:hypothetical protein [Xanthomonas translucens]MCC8447749.1 hypothetical protein [Xanthomonas translucens pv. translucens]MCS3360435.1 hypothetical protein [Xanthomonas translucens pv. translucens]MCS3373495.1 hypothetical protein [Xanthomonas translucens pv. translucens]MCT8275602.1 hypothetical protein [Xanthomonas translucens pv. translucens]MCT8279231.1 hypothetical protein [Xanthomonas translucens pv. translucens]
MIVGAAPIGEPMHDATIAQTDHPRRSSPLPVGMLLLAVWASWSAASLLLLAKPPASADAIRRQLQAFASTTAPRGQAVAFQLRAAGCDCDPGAPASTPPGLRSVDLRQRPAPASLPYALVVFDAGDRLVYAGPTQIEGCGKAIAAATLIPRLLAAGNASPLILPTHCACR